MILLQSAHCGRSGFDRNHAVEARRQPPRKQAHAGKKIPRQRTAESRSNTLHQTIHQPAIHLKKCAVIHAIIETRGAI